MIVATVVLYLSASVAIASALGHRLHELHEARKRRDYYKARVQRES